MDRKRFKLSELHEHPDNDLFDSNEGIEGLALSIKDQGLLELPIVKPDGQILSGHRRIRAIRSLKWSEVECRIFTGSDEDAFRLLITQNTGRRQVGRNIRMRIYKKAFPEILDPDQKWNETRVKPIADYLEVSIHTILKDIRSIHAPKVTIDKIRTAWNNKKGFARINQVDRGDGNWIIIVSGKNYQYEFGPGELEKVQLDCYKKATSKHFASRMGESSAAAIALQKLRKKMGVSQTSMAIHLGISQSYLAELEAGKYPKMTDEYVQKAEKLFGTLLQEAGLA